MTGSPALCDVKRGLRRCGEPAAGVCQYCGRSFCAGHGQFLPGGQEICARKICQEKHQDLARHLVYKRTAAERNRSGVCGHPGCGQQPSGQCSKCAGLFCGAHLESRDDISGRGYRATVRRLSLCPHCWARRPLWSRI
jgi:hypothetical protein